MSLSLQKLPKIKRNSRIRVGRGIGSGKGKTSGRGVKGQKARTGHHSVKGFEGGQTPVYMRLPKKGFKTLSKKKEFVNTDAILRLIESKKINSLTIVTKNVLKSVGLISEANSKVKLIMGNRDTSGMTFRVEVDCYSEKAKSFS